MGTKMCIYLILGMAFFMYYQENPMLVIIILVIGGGAFFYYKSNKIKNGGGRFLSGRVPPQNTNIDNIVTLMILQQILGPNSQGVQSKASGQELTDDRKKEIVKSKETALKLLEDY